MACLRADVVLDMRFADNPHWIDDLREKTGEDAKIDAYLRQDEIAQSVLSDLKRMLTPMLGRMSAEVDPCLRLPLGAPGDGTGLSGRPRPLANGCESGVMISH